jgi:hypothetical protein
VKYLHPLTALLLLSAACSDEPPVASANLRHPSGMVYLERSITDTSTRADLYIADAEAEGVRVRQFFRGIDENGAAYVIDTFVPSEAIFIPLVISAPGFPEEISPAVYSGAGTPRASLYALAPAGVVSELDPATGDSRERFGLLHVLDIRENSFGARASEAGNFPIGLLPLDELLAEPAIPTDVEVVASLADRDLVLVAFDPINGGPGQVALLSVQVGPSSVTLLGSSTATVADLPRALLHAGNGQVLVSSAGTSTVTELTLDLVAGTFLGSRALPAGGPTQGLISIPGYGALALRVDRPSVAVFTSTTGRFERSTAVFASPYTPRAEQLGTPPADRSGELSVGRLDLRGSPVVTGAHGRVANLRPSADLPTPVLSTDLTADPDGVARADVVLLAHLDGRVSFLVGNPPRLAILTEQALGLIDLGKVTGATVLTSTVVECLTAPVRQLGTVTDFQCADSVFVVNPSSPRRLRAQYRGALSVGPAGVLTPTSSTGATWTLTDSAVEDYTALKIQVGDLVDLEHHGADCTVPDSPAQDYRDRAVITAVSAEGLELSTAGEFRGLRDPCGEVVVRYEVFPAGDEAVLTEAVGGRVGAVLARTPIIDNGGRREAQFTGDLAFTLIGSLACDEADLGRLCGDSSDCGGRTCVPNVDTVGPGLCSGGMCPADSGTCVSQPVVRRCAGVEILSEPAGPLALDLRNITTNSQISRAAVPAAAVFARVRQSWFVSYPGSRSLATVEPLVESIQTTGYTR